MWAGNMNKECNEKRTRQRRRNISSSTVAKMVPIDCEYSQSSVLFNHEQKCGLYREKEEEPVANHKRLST